MLNGGTATVKDFEMRDGIIDVDASTSAPFGFFGFQFSVLTNRTPTSKNSICVNTTLASQTPSNTRRFSILAATGSSSTGGDSPTPS